jgi:hypothetical protein
MMYRRGMTSVGAGLLANAISQRHQRCLTQRIAGKRAPTTGGMTYHRLNGIRRSRLAGERNLPAPPALPDTTRSPASRLLQVQWRVYVSGTHSRQQSAIGNRQSATGLGLGQIQKRFAPWCLGG